jgi:Protein of unknown function (DUF4054)
MPNTFPPAITDFKSYFNRDFIYGGDGDMNKIQDNDITRALNEANSVFNTALWSGDPESATAYLYIAAHYLVQNIKMAGGIGGQSLNAGLNSRGGGGAVQSKSVGSVSLNYALPESITNNPILFSFMETDYGVRYLNMVIPRLVGTIFVVPGFSESDLANG